MFENLFGSKTRVKLLSLFLNNPDRPYFVREITRKIDEQINSVRRELSNLLQIGLVKSDSQNNKLYYEVNQEYEHYQQLRAIFANIPIASTKVMKETREEEGIAKKLRACGRIDLALLTGVFTRTNHVPVDALVVGDVNRSKVTRVFAELEGDMNRELNYSVMTPEDYSYRLNLNDRFLSTIMDAKKIVLIDGSEQPLDHKDLKVDDDAEIEDGATAIPVNLEAD